LTRGPDPTQGSGKYSTCVGVEPEAGAAPTELCCDPFDAGPGRWLHRSWYYDPNTIKVSAHGGAITLTGDVTTFNARDLAGATAWSAPGATSVENDIRVVS